MMHMEKEKFIREVAAAAREDWQGRHICLPSLTIALAIEGSRWGKRSEAAILNELFTHRRDGCMERHASFQAAIHSHNNYLATWREQDQTAPNWKDLIGQKHYILAVQCLQDAEYPYYSSSGYERKLVELIEKYKLYKYDKE